MKKLLCMADLWLFDSLNTDEKANIQNLFRRPCYKKGEFLFMEGEPASAIFVVTEGKVKLFKTSEDGKEIVLGFLSPHDLFGEEVLFNDSTHSLSAQVLENTHLCACYKSDFEALVAQNSAISIKVIKMLGDKLSKMAEQLADIAVYDTQNRVARTLARLAREHGESTEYGRRLNFHLTHEDLGALVGASRVMVTNVLKSLRKAGVVCDDGNRRFTVSNWFLAKPDLSDEIMVGSSAPTCQCFKH